LKRYVCGVVMEKRKRYDAIILISCERGQVMDIIEHIKKRFPDVEAAYEVIQEEE